MVQIREMTVEDWPAVERIYREGLQTGHATFEPHPPTWEEWNASHIASCRLVAHVDGVILGWAALSRVSGRCVYAGVAEVSIYVATAAQGKGVGTRLLKRLIEASEAQGFWTLQAGIFPENAASIWLHEKCGFRQVGRRERLGQLNGIWRDVLLLERRSAAVG